MKKLIFLLLLLVSGHAYAATGGSQCQVVREYQLSSQSASAAQSAVQMTMPSGSPFVRVLVRAKGDQIVVNFGGSAVVASNTVASNKLTDGNFTIADGEVDSFNLNTLSQNYVSAENVAQASGATLFVRVCAVPW